MWKLIASIALSCIVTGAAAWMTFGRDKICRSEMVDYVQNQAPWAKERGEIMAEIKLNSRHIKELTDSVKELVTSQHAMLIEQRVMVSQFANYIEGQKKGG